MNTYLYTCKKPITKGFAIIAAKTDEEAFACFKSFYSHWLNRIFEGALSDPSCYDVEVLEGAAIEAEPHWICGTMFEDIAHPRKN